MIRTQHKFKRHRVSFSSMYETNATIRFWLSFKDFRKQDRRENVLFSQRCNKRNEQIHKQNKSRKIKCVNRVAYILHRMNWNQSFSLLSFSFHFFPFHCVFLFFSACPMIRFSNNIIRMGNIKCPSTERLILGNEDLEFGTRFKYLKNLTTKSK